MNYSHVNQKYTTIFKKSSSVNSLLPFASLPAHSQLVYLLYGEIIGNYVGERFPLAEFIPSMMNLFVKLLVVSSEADWSQLHYVVLISYIWQ